MDNGKHFIVHTLLDCLLLYESLEIDVCVPNVVSAAESAALKKGVGRLASRHSHPDR